MKRKTVKKRGKKKAKPLITQTNSEAKKLGLEVIQGGKSKKSTIIKGFFYFILLFVLLFAVILNSVAPTGIVEWINVKRAVSQSGDGFPISFSDSSASKLHYDNNQLYILTESVLLGYNNKGNRIYSRLHGFANPVIKSSAIRTLIFDRAGNQYRIENADDTVIMKSLDNKIINGYICDNGYYAIATESDSDVAVVTVYNKNHKPVYKYYSANNYVSSVALSANGKFLSVITINTKNTKFVSKVEIYDINKTDAIFAKELDDEFIYTADFVTQKSVALVTDKRWLCVSASGKINELKFGTETLVKYEIAPNKKTLICLSSDTNANSSSVKIVNADGSIYGSFNVDTDISGISMYNSRVYIMSSKLFTYTNNGKLLKSDEIDTGAVDVKAMKNQAVILYSTKAQVY